MLDNTAMNILLVYDEPFILKRFRISIDDFGRGHASFAPLRVLSFDDLKIDRSFVHRAGADATVRTFFDTRVTLGNPPGTVIVADGVEDQTDGILRGNPDALLPTALSSPSPRPATFN